MSLGQAGPYGGTVRPWVLRALVVGGAYGIGQTVFVALRSTAPDLLVLWSVLLLAALLSLVIGWVGAEVVLDRRPPEWSWFLAALAGAPIAGLLSWILLSLFVDDTGVEDLQPALISRAAFTALLVLAGVAVGSRLGWLSLRRHGEGAGDPNLDADDDALAREVAQQRAESAPLPRVAVPSAPPPGPSVAGVRTPSRRDRPAPSAAGPAVEERERMPAGRLAAMRRVSRVQSGTADEATPVVPGSSDPEPVESPVVAVLPTTELPAMTWPSAPGTAAPAEAEEPEQPRRRFGLRRPGRSTD